MSREKPRQVPPFFFIILTLILIAGLVAIVPRLQQGQNYAGTAVRMDHAICTAQASEAACVRCEQVCGEQLEGITCEGNNCACNCGVQKYHIVLP